MAANFLTFSKDADGIIFSCLAPNGISVGDLYPATDGFYVYHPSRNRSGYLSEKIVSELATKLKELNKAWGDTIRQSII